MSRRCSPSGRWGASVCAAVLLMPALHAQEQARAAAAAELAAKANRGELTVALALEALGSAREDDARIVASILRNEWQALPDELFDGLDLDARAARRFLEELALAPRPAALRWVRSQALAHRDRSYDHRMFAFAARGEALTRDEAAVLVESLRRERPSDGFYHACAHLTPKLADGLVGRLHALLMEGDVDVASISPLLERLSARGTKSLLGLAMTLPQPVALQLLRQVVERRPDLAYARVDAALDGQLPLDPAWLAFAAERIDRPERVARVLGVLRDSDDPAHRELAFEALLAAQVVDAAVLQVATDDASTARIRRVIARAADRVPVDYVIRWLRGEPRVAEAMASALGRRPTLPPALQREALTMLGEVEVAAGRAPLYLLQAVVRGGDEGAVAQVWPLVVDSPAWRDLLDRIGRRDEPFVQRLFERELSRALRLDAGDRGGDEQAEQLDTLRLHLAARGDRAALAALVANAPSRSAPFLRRCRQRVPSVSAEQAAALVTAAFIGEDPEQASELLEWAASSQPAGITDALWKFWQDPPADNPMVEELCATVARLLLAGTRREDLLAQLRTALPRGPLEDARAALPFEVLNSMGDPLASSELRLCAEMLLVAPIGDPAAEQQQVRRWPDGSFGFPLVQALAARLRTADEARAVAAFAAVVAELDDQPDRLPISRQRLQVFWRALSKRPSLQLALGRVTSRLWSATAAHAAVPEGAALWLQAQDAEQLGAHAAAARLYESAGRQLLRLPSDRARARWLLGERDPANGVDPVAALAAAPARMRLMAARAAGDRAAERAAAAAVAEFAGRDAATRATVSNLTEDSGR